jgi:hypothetical protein
MQSYGELYNAKIGCQMASGGCYVLQNKLPDFFRKEYQLFLIQGLQVPWILYMFKQCHSLIPLSGPCILDCAANQNYIMKFGELQEQSLTEQQSY